MKMEVVLTSSERVLFRVIYKEKEWKELEKVYIRNNYEKYTTKNLWGEGKEGTVYRIRGETRIIWEGNIYINGLRLIDDINQPIIKASDGRLTFNFAILRLIPEKRDEVYVAEGEAKIDNFLFTVYDLKLIAKAIRRYLSFINNRIKKAVVLIES